MNSSERLEFIAPDYKLAYAALARRLAAVEAYLLHDDTVNAMQEVKAALVIVERVEQPVPVLTCTSGVPG
jgi:hypothetical protein